MKVKVSGKSRSGRRFGRDGRQSLGTSEMVVSWKLCMHNNQSTTLPSDFAREELGILVDNSLVRSEQCTSGNRAVADFADNSLRLVTKSGVR